MSPDASKPPDDAIAVDREHPWLGLVSFTEETRDFFYGREEEVAELVRRVQRKLLTILFGQSGLGKTSILRAGVAPRLRREGYCPIYVRIDYSPDTPAPSEQIKQAVFRETKASGEWTQVGVAQQGESLWEFLHHRGDVLLDASAKPLTPLLIFDQFEEIFTLAQADAFGRERAAQFLDDLADLVENRAPRALEARIEQDDAAAEQFDFARADYRILIALREDYLAHLEGLKAGMPSITQNRMRLARMTGDQALAAVVKPGGSLVSTEVAEAIVRFIAGGAELRNAEVEPSLLSLICRELNNARIREGRSEISADLLAGSRDSILSEFYERALADQPPGVRQVIEDHLLTDSGYRESLAEERLQRLFSLAGAPADALATLVNRRLLRIEERLDVRRVELTHDVLCSVVKASRDLRLEREARDEAERKLAAQRERERATRHALVRARKVAAVCAVLAVGALGSAIFGYVSMKRAQDAEAKAEQTRVMAETARGEAEKLVVYLLDDFQLELAPVGRLDIVADLAKRALDYYAGLPEALRTAQTERNRALALVRYGAVLRTQAREAESGKALDEAVKILAAMREQGDRSEATTIGLALGLATQARLTQGSSGADKHGFALSERAVEVIGASGNDANASIAMRRARGEVLTAHGYGLDRARDPRVFAVLDDARAAFRSIDDLALGDMPAAAGYAEATVWKVQALMNLGRTDEAMGLAHETLAITTQMLAKRPGHMQALRVRGVVTSTLARAHFDKLQPLDALRMSDATIESWEEFLRLDPSNAISLFNLGVSRWIRSNILADLGRWSDSIATLREAAARNEQASPSLFLGNQRSLFQFWIAKWEAERGNARSAEDALRKGEASRTWIVQNAPPGSWLAASRALFNPMARAVVASSLGDTRRALDLGRATAPKLEALVAPDEGARIEQGTVLRGLYLAMAHAAYDSGDYAAAERHASEALDQRRRAPAFDLNDRRDDASHQMLRAIALARLGRHDEARKLVGPALAMHRELATINHGSVFQRFELAQALVAAAASGLGDARAQRLEAQRLLDGLPAELREINEVKFWRARLAEAGALRP